MNELIAINSDSKFPVSGRELHMKLKVETRYNDWFPRMCEYGFEEGKDFYSKLSESTGGRPSGDHDMSLSMAKEICMIQRTDAGKQVRHYLISIEEQWNQPEVVMARALKMADAKILSITQRLTLAEVEIAQDKQLIAELQPKASYYDLILQSKEAIAMTLIAKDYGMSAKTMNKILHELGVQYSLQGTWILYQKYAEQGYTQSKTHPIDAGRSRMHTYWTQKGRLFLYELLKSGRGIFPLIERVEKVG